MVGDGGQSALVQSCSRILNALSCQGFEASLHHPIGLQEDLLDCWPLQRSYVVDLDVRCNAVHHPFADSHPFQDSYDGPSWH